MARTVNETLVCDICGTESRVASYSIVAPEGVAVLDLCPGDAKPLLKLWQAGSTEPRKRVTGDQRRSSGHAVVPVD